MEFFELLGAAMGAQAFNIELMKRLPELFQKAHPKVIPCHECGKPIPAKKAINALAVKPNKLISKYEATGSINNDTIKPPPNRTKNTRHEKNKKQKAAM